MFDRFVTKEACTSYLMWNDTNEGFIVDPGYNANNCLIKHIQKLNLKIVAVLLTHGHYDHIGALEDIFKAYPEASLYLSEDEIEVVANPRYNLSAYPEEGNDVRPLTFLPKKVIGLVDYENFIVAGYKIQMIKTPFHTCGSCCFYLERENILFSGDTLFASSIGRSDLPSGSARSIESSLRKLISLPIKTKVYPGHGAETSLERELKYNSYLRNL